MKYLLLSHAINEDTPLYGDTPGPLIVPHSRISNGASSNTSIISIHNHTGTHIDAPKHFIDRGRSIFEYSFEELIFKNTVILDCTIGEAELLMPENLMQSSFIPKDVECLLLRTGFEQYRNENIYVTHNPGISPETILWLRAHFPRIRCIGVDTISISSFQKREIGRQAHKNAFMEQKGLGAPLLIIEDMKLSEVTRSIKCLVVLPLQLEEIDSAPCNVLAIFEDS
ncbi:cyclase family protein [uncultured Methanolobus sp.]|uniref:cyclase family protein n=1 Tax=uncultured Methanolobus sp. TaxID=218300 RepID=UPI0029C837A4|nr:cyclase family protein [uncultured Methanolobus sp.]